MVAEMFNKLILIFLAIVISLCGWIWFQHGTINDLKAENQTQASLIAEQEKVNQSLKDTIETERQAVEQQRVIHDEIKQASQDKIQAVRKLIKTQPCYNTRIYDDAIERLR